MRQRENMLPGIGICVSLLIAGLPGQAAEPVGAEVSSELVSPDEGNQRLSGGAQESLLPSLPPREAFDEIVERPLFSESRRPDAAQEDVNATSANELREQWRLTGIVMVGDELKAMLQQRDGDRHLTLTPGMPLDASWSLEEIHPDNVIMGAAGEQVKLDLLEPRDTTPVEKPDTPPPEDTEQSAPGDEVRPLEERARDAQQQVRQGIQRIQENTEAQNE